MSKIEIFCTATGKRDLHKFKIYSGAKIKTNGLIKTSVNSDKDTDTGNSVDVGRFSMQTRVQSTANLLIVSNLCNYEE
jgi:hypothetical protein